MGIKYQWVVRFYRKIKKAGKKSRLGVLIGSWMAGYGRGHGFNKFRIRTAAAPNHIRTGLCYFLEVQSKLCGGLFVVSSVSVRNRLACIGLDQYGFVGRSP